MLRRIALLSSGALALSTVIIAPGIATAKPVTGNVSCTLTGKATISPGLPLTSPGNATKNVKTTTTFTGTLSNCTGTQANTKGGAQIDGGTLTATAKTKTAKGQPLGSCAGLANPDYADRAEGENNVHERRREAYQLGGESDGRRRDRLARRSRSLLPVRCREAERSRVKL